MSPKDMTNEELFIKTQHRPLVSDTCEFNAWSDVCVELLYRLNEADALRKENAGLRDALIDARSWMDAGMFEDVPPQYTAMVANVDAMLSKESEASHE